MDTGEKSVITAAKDLITNVIKTIDGKMTVVRNNVDEQNEKAKRTQQFVCILTADGSFDELKAKTIRHQVETTLYQIKVRGARKIPLEVRVYGKTETQTDVLLENILSSMPRTWKIGQRYGTIEILTEHSNDYASNYKDGAMQSAFVMVSMEIGTPATEVALLKPTNLSGGINNE